jgi:ribosome maturation factor RimP
MGYFCLVVFISRSTDIRFMVKEEIRRLVEESSGKHGAHVVDFVMRGAKQKSIVEVFVDSESGVTSDLCSRISRDIEEAFDAHNVLDGVYELVVSSPGIERPLKFPWQFKKHLGRQLAVAVQTDAGREKRTGKLVAVEDKSVLLEARTGTFQIRFDAIEEAVVKAPW